MKNIGVFLAWLLFCGAAYAQGTVVFNNRVPGSVDARLVLPDGTGAGAGWRAQLVLRGAGGTVTPLTPVTTFRTSSQAAMGYVEPVDVSVPGVPAGARATLVMRAFNGSTFDTSSLRYESNPVTITLGGGVLPPANLVGLQSFALVPTVSAPLIVLQPVSQTLVPGSTVTFKVEVSGTGPFTYQWKKNGVAISGATQETLVLSNVTEADIGTYMVTVSNSAGSVNSLSAILSIPADENTGAILFNNRVPGTVDARVMVPPDFTVGAGAGWHAQLFVAPEGQTSYKALLPMTTFRSTSSAAMGYVEPIDVKVPGFKPGTKATFVMRVFNGTSFETSPLRLESNPFTVAVGGGTLPPSNLIGLKSFRVVTTEFKPFVERDLPPGYAPGSTLVVTLKATPPSGISVYAIEEFPPENWIVGSINEGGTYDAGTKKVKWGPFFDRNSRTLTYEVKPPAAETGRREFTGTSSADGMTVAVAGDAVIEPATFHPADNNPADSRMSISEVTAYGSAWRKGQTWPLSPNPIPIEFVTRAGTLWKNGEVYTRDARILSPPLWWVNVPAGGRSLQPDSERLIVLNANTENGHAVGALHPLFVPGEPVLVRILVEPGLGVSSYAAQDMVPAGWAVAKISDGGEFDAAARLVKWGPFFDNQSRVLGYEVLPPADSALEAEFAGSASFDGNNTPVRGQRRVRATSRVKSISFRADGKFELNLSGHLGTALTVEASSDLTQWVRVGTVAKPGGTITFDDPDADRRTFRFYRVIVQ